MLVGWGGNNGSTLTAAVLANRLRLSWPTRTGRKVGVELGAAEAGLRRRPSRRLALRGWVHGEGLPRGRDSKEQRLRWWLALERYLQRAGSFHPSLLTPRLPTLFPPPPLHRCPQEANYYGSLTQAGTVSLGLDAEGKEVFVPLHALLPMVSPDDLVFDGGRGSGPGLGREAGPRGAQL